MWETVSHTLHGFPQAGDSLGLEKREEDPGLENGLGRFLFVFGRGKKRKKGRREQNPPLGGVYRSDPRFFKS
jgi:hypothetical protein